MNNPVAFCYVAPAARNRDSWVRSMLTGDPRGDYSLNWRVLVVALCCLCGGGGFIGLLIAAARDWAVGDVEEPSPVAVQRVHRQFNQRVHEVFNSNPAPLGDFDELGPVLMPQVEYTPAQNYYVIHQKLNKKAGEVFSPHPSAATIKEYNQLIKKLATAFCNQQEVVSIYPQLRASFNDKEMRQKVKNGCKITGVDLLGLRGEVRSIRHHRRFKKHLEERRGLLYALTHLKFLRNEASDEGLRQAIRSQEFVAMQDAAAIDCADNESLSTLVEELVAKKLLAEPRIEIFEQGVRQKLGALQGSFA